MNTFTIDTKEYFSRCYKVNDTKTFKNLVVSFYTTLDLLKIKVFWSKGYDVIISVHDVANKILSRDTYYIVDVVIWPKFCNSSTSMKEVIITSIL